MTPQTVPLYAVATWNDVVDLLLVVGWHQVDDLDAYPFVVYLRSTGSEPSTIASLIHQGAGNVDAKLSVHDGLTYYVDLDEARLAYDETAAGFEPTEPGEDRAGHQVPCSCAAGREPQLAAEITA